MQETSSASLQLRRNSRLNTESLSAGLECKPVKQLIKLSFPKSDSDGFNSCSTYQKGRFSLTINIAKLQKRSEFQQVIRQLCINALKVSAFQGDSIGQYQSATLEWDLDLNLKLSIDGRCRLQISEMMHLYHFAM